MSVIARTWWLIVAEDGDPIGVAEDEREATETIKRWGGLAVEVAPVNQPPGAVKRAEQWEKLARDLYRLMGEEGERLLPGDLESSELLRDGGQ